VIFDLDGTLIDSMPRHAEVFASVVIEHRHCGISHEQAIALYHSTAGLPLAAQFERACRRAAPDIIDQLEGDFWTLVNLADFGPFPDAVPCLEQLSQAGIKLAVSSGGSNASVARKLAGSDLGRFFTIALGSDDPRVGVKGPQHRDLVVQHFFATGVPRQLRVTFVGDTEHDMLVARAMGAVAIGVQRDARLLPDNETSSDVRLDDLTELPDLLLELQEG
jgi:phosphoglycolate phosphatase-like HAD superfamily hydrolase